MVSSRVAESPEAISDPERRKRALLAAAAVLLLVGLVWLWVTAGSPRDDLRRFFGLWQTRNVLLAAALAWGALSCLMRWRSRNALLVWIIANVATLLGVGLIEAAGFLGVANFPKVFGAESGPALGSRAVPNLDLRGVTYEDTARAWGLPTEPIPFHYRTDRRGFRNARDRADADIYLLGDSFLVAGLVPFEQTVAGQLEQRSRRTVMNLALIAISPEEERNILLASKVPLSGRTLVHFIFEGNDLADSAAFAKNRGAPPASSLSRSERTFSYQFLMKLQEWSSPVHPRANHRTCTIDDRVFTFAWAHETMRCPDCVRQMPSVLRALEEVRRHVESAGGRYAVVLVPDKLRVLGPLCEWPSASDIQRFDAHLSEFPKALAAWSLDTGVPFLDLTDTLTAAATRRPIPWFSGDTHWNAAGCDAAVRALMAWPFLAPPR